MLGQSMWVLQHCVEVSSWRLLRFRARVLLPQLWLVDAEPPLGFAECKAQQVSTAPKALGILYALSELEARRTMRSAGLDEPMLVIVADDDDDMRALVTATLRADGCTTLEARDGRELLELLEHAHDDPMLLPDVVVSDVRMPGLSGLGVLQVLQQAHWRLPVVMMTIVSDEIDPYCGQASWCRRGLAQAF
jgi:CheY-like chemotaxis protein